MWVVALLKVGSIDAEIAALGVELGVTAYEAGQVVRGHLPSIVLKTPDEARAHRLVAALRARGNEALACDATQAVAAEAMHELRGFRFEPDALVSLNQNGTSERLPWVDFTAIVRAMHKVSGTSTETSRERKFSLGRAVLTQGLSMSKTVTKESVTEGEKREPVLYLFRRGGLPWLTSETRARYDGLGAEIRPARLENFNTLVRKLRERVPTVPYDERLMSVRSGGERVHADLVGAQRTSSNASTVDLLAHLIAAALTDPTVRR